jgi:DNA-binding MarR family transcriptional regulator
VSRGPLIRDIQLALRGLVGGLGRLNVSVAARVQLRGDDVELLDTITRRGPVTPSELATATGVHPATLTGILDRLERGGWLVRRRDMTDRRKVVLEGLPDRTGELLRLYGPMSRSIADLCSGYSTDELALIRDFLRRAGDAADVAIRIARDAPTAAAEGDG